MEKVLGCDWEPKRNAHIITSITIILVWFIPSHDSSPTGQALQTTLCKVKTCTSDSHASISWALEKK